MLLRCCSPIPKYGLPPLSTPMAEGQWNQTRQFHQLYPTIWLLPEHLVIKVCWFQSLYFRLSTRDWIVGPLLFVALNLFGQKGVLLFHYRSSCGSQASPCLHSPVLAREWMRPELGYLLHKSAPCQKWHSAFAVCVLSMSVYMSPVRHGTVLIVNAVECMPGDLFLILLSLWLIIILVSWKFKKNPYTRFISAQSFQQY